MDAPLRHFNPIGEIAIKYSPTRDKPAIRITNYRHPNRPK